MPHLTPYLIMTLSGFAFFVTALAWGQVQSAIARRRHK